MTSESSEGRSPRTTSPRVSVVMPVINEERHLQAAVAQILDQDYDGQLEVVIAVAASTDRTAEVAAALANQDTRVRVVGNPTGATPAGLNAAIGACSGDVVVRVDG
ncbi:MAG: glycosyltransferase, partial [Actinomycetales bacterium]